MIGDQETDVGVQFSQRNDAHLVQVPEKPANFFILVNLHALLYKDLYAMLSSCFTLRAVYKLHNTSIPQPFSPGITSKPSLSSLRYVIYANLAILATA